MSNHTSEVAYHVEQTCEVVKHAQKTAEIIHAKRKIYQEIQNLWGPLEKPMSAKQYWALFQNAMEKQGILWGKYDDLGKEMNDHSGKIENAHSNESLQGQK